MRISALVPSLLSAARFGVCQQIGGDGGLSAAIANDTQLSGFRQILLDNGAVFNSILPDGTSSSITVLVPTNEALEKFYNKTGEHLASVSRERLASVLRYHALAAKLTNANITGPQRTGIAVPTLLRDEQFNNRSAGAALISQFGAAAAQGNVVFLSRDRFNPAKLRVRQSDSAAASLRGGLATDAGITAVDGVWALGYYQLIDTILEPPASCSNTIRSLPERLQGLGTALNRTSLWTALDHTPNVTCLAPTTDAFTAAGNPHTDLNATLLRGALLFHTLPEVTYSNYLQDGLVFKSLAGGDVRVTIVGEDIYFNDAKVVSPNVLTNNGLIHVLDKVMSPNGTAPPPTPSTTTPSSTTTPTPSQSSNSASHWTGGNVSGAGTWAGLLAFAVAAVLA